MEFLSDVYAWTMENWDEMAIILVSLWAAAEGIVRLTPTKLDDGFLTRVGKFVDKVLIWFPNLKKPTK